MCIGCSRCSLRESSPEAPPASRIWSWMLPYLPAAKRFSSKRCGAESNSHAKAMLAFAGKSRHRHHGLSRLPHPLASRSGRPPLLRRARGKTTDLCAARRMVPRHQALGTRQVPRRTRKTLLHQSRPGHHAGFHRLVRTHDVPTRRPACKWPHQRWSRRSSKAKLTGFPAIHRPRQQSRQPRIYCRDSMNTCWVTKTAALRSLQTRAKNLPRLQWHVHPHHRDRWPGRRHMEAHLEENLRGDHRESFQIIRQGSKTRRLPPQPNLMANSLAEK